MVIVSKKICEKQKRARQRLLASLNIVRALLRSFVRERLNHSFRKTLRCCCCCFLGFSLLLDFILFKKVKTVVEKRSERKQIIQYIA